MDQAMKHGDTMDHLIAQSEFGNIQCLTNSQQSLLIDLTIALITSPGCGMPESQFRWRVDGRALPDDSNEYLAKTAWCFSSQNGNVSLTIAGQNYAQFLLGELNKISAERQSSELENTFSEGFSSTREVQLKEGETDEYPLKPKSSCWFQPNDDLAACDQSTATSANSDSVIHDNFKEESSSPWKQLTHNHAKQNKEFTCPSETVRSLNLTGPQQELLKDLILILSDSGGKMKEEKLWSKHFQITRRNVNHLGVTEKDFLNKVGIFIAIDGDKKPNAILTSQGNDYAQWLRSLGRSEQTSPVFSITCSLAGSQPSLTGSDIGAETPPPPNTDVGKSSSSGGARPKTKYRPLDMSSKPRFESAPIENIGTIQSGKDGRNQEVRITASVGQNLFRNERIRKYPDSHKKVLKEHIEALTKQCMERIAADRMFVEPVVVEARLCEELQVNHLGQVGVGFRRGVPDLSSVHELVSKIRRVDAHITASLALKGVNTLYDTLEDLREIIEDNQSYDALGLGPATRNPVIQRLFGVPSGCPVMKITSGDVYAKVREYRRDVWRRQIDLVEFMEYLKAEYGVDDVFILGVKISSIGLCVSAVSRAEKQEMAAASRFFRRIESDCKNSIDSAYISFRMKLMTKEGEDFHARSHYLNQDPWDVLNDVMEKLDMLLKTVADCGTADVEVDRFALSYFKRALCDTRLIPDLFKFAIVMSNYQITNSIDEYLRRSDLLEKEEPTDTDTKIEPVDKHLVVETMASHFEACFSVSGLNLTHLKNIEIACAQNFNRDTFTELGHGSFLEFLLMNERLSELLRENGGVMLGGNNQMTASVYRPSLNDIIELVLPYLLHAPADKDRNTERKVERIACYHYKVKEFIHLGLGPVRRVLERKVSKKPRNVVCLAGLCYDSAAMDITEKSQGIFGNREFYNALNFLNECPLLNDLSQWSQWELVFAPSHGNLKDFIEKHGGTGRYTYDGKDCWKDLAALEVEPGKLIRLTSNTDVDKFRQAVETGSPRVVCGHLVSLIVLRGFGVGLPLLGNIIRGHLYKLCARAPGLPSSGENEQAPVDFVRDCLCVLPLMICVELAHEVFIGPLRDILGRNSKEMETRLAKSCTDYEHKTRLAVLGYFLCISKWQDMFETVTTPEEKEFKGNRNTHSNNAHDCKTAPDVTYDVADDEKPVGETPEQGLNETVSTELDHMRNVDGVNESPLIKNDYVENNDSMSPLRNTPLPFVKSDEGQDAPKDPLNLRPKNLIDFIRHDFGIGVIMDDPAQAVVTKHKQMLNRSMERLSEDLYTKDTHFVLELVQNADDNEYDVPIPSIQFIIDEERITILNNEVGFRNHHVLALCDVGNSTKTEDQASFIGRKGIGFKSVFRVTNRPEVHSNGFRFRFDAAVGEMLPNWIEEISEISDGLSDSKWQTKIVLPLKEEIKKNFRSLLCRFEEIHPSLLLFLHRLKCLQIDDKISGTTALMTRKDLKEKLVEIRHNDAIERWLVVRKTLDASKLELNSKKNAMKTEVALAFPVGSDAPGKQAVFAFLPLREYGFRFVIQADFDLPSNREDLNADSTWNQWLRNEIVPTFVHALDDFKNIEENSLHAVRKFLSFIPREDEIMEFFKPVARGIFTGLCAEEFLPDEDLKCKLPSELIMETDSFIRETFNNGMMERFLGLSYINPDVVVDKNKQLLQDLGVRSLTTKDMLDIVESQVVAWDGISTPEIVQNIAQILVCLQKRMNDFDALAPISEKLRGLNIIPDSRGQLVATSRTAVFFHPESGSDYHIRSKILRDDLTVVDPNLLSSVDQESYKIIDILEKIGVKRITPREIISQHILPTYRNGNWRSKDAETLMEYVVFMHMFRKDLGRIISFTDLSDIIQLSTSHGIKNPLRDSIHFTTVYQNVIDLASEFPSFDWCLLVEDYLRAEDGTVKSWRQFFEKLGVVDSFIVKPVKKILTADSPKDTLWEELWSQLNKDSRLEITDYESVELETVIKSAISSSVTTMEKSHRQMQCLLKSIARDWKRLAPFVFAKITGSGNECSSLGHTLKATPWLPGIKKGYDELKQEFTQKHCLCVGKDLYVKGGKAEQFLSFHAPYLDPGMDNDPRDMSGILEFLKVKVNLTKEDLLRFFYEWIELEKFTTETNHMKNVYTFFQRQIPPAELDTIFRQHKAIFIPNKTFQRGIVTGKFYPLTDVCWSDPHDLFYRYNAEIKGLDSSSQLRPIQILKQYPAIYEQKPSFGVLEEPPFDMYRHLLDFICTHYPRCSARIADVIMCYDILTKRLMEDRSGNLLCYWEKDFQEKKIIPTRRDFFVSLEDRPVWPDQPRIEDLFADADNIHFVDFDPKKQMKTAKGDVEFLKGLFLGSLCVRKLSASYDERIVTTTILPFATLRNYFHSFVGSLQKFIFHKFEDIYLQLTERRTASFFNELKFYSANGLEAVYELTYLKDLKSEERTKIEKRKCHLHCDTPGEVLSSSLPPLISRPPKPDAQSDHLRLR